MTEEKLMQVIREKPKGIEAQAYRLGRKTMSCELKETIEKVIQNQTGKIK